MPGQAKRKKTVRLKLNTIRYRYLLLLPSLCMRYSVPQLVHRAVHIYFPTNIPIGVLPRPPRALIMIRSALVVVYEYIPCVLHLDASHEGWRLLVAVLCSCTLYAQWLPCAPFTDSLLQTSICVHARVVSYCCNSYTGSVALQKISKINHSTSGYGLSSQTNTVGLPCPLLRRQSPTAVTKAWHMSCSEERKTK